MFAGLLDSLLTLTPSYSFVKSFLHRFNIVKILVFACLLDSLLTLTPGFSFVKLFINLLDKAHQIDICSSSILLLSL